MASNNYGGEEFLLEQLPDYPKERITLIIKLIVAFVCWTIILPVLFSEQVEENENCNNKENQNVSAEPPKKASKKKKNDATNKKSIIDQQTPPPQPVREVSSGMLAYCCFGCMLTLAWVMLKSSPDNNYTPRGVFQASLFSPDECDFLVDMADRVAQRNYQEAQASILLVDEQHSPNTKIQEMLQEPVGWQKTRHGNYPTTDLNVVTDPFTKQDRAWIQEKFDARLAPTLGKIYGIPPSSIRANDVSVCLHSITSTKVELAAPNSNAVCLFC